ncbi:MAG: DUF21 domain-containing protein [Dehalococcoidales bacterium]|nr:DUF21 domain-containing protein [Dehalococcoidales bacterium]
MNVMTWVLIAVCVSQSAIFSGLNLAFFSVSKLRLEIEVSKGNRDARKVQTLRKDSNFLLVTILWGNVGVNVLLAILADSVLAGVLAFLFSTILITIIGEIIPQAYFSRHAIRMGSLLSPLIRFYQIVLFIVAKPTAMALDLWLGREAIVFFKEEDFKELVQMHVETSESDIGKTEGQGVINFLTIDDIAIEDEGEPVDDKSIITLDFKDERPVFPEMKAVPDDPFVRCINASGKKWVILVDSKNSPRAVLNADGFIRDLLFQGTSFDPNAYYHKPIVYYGKNNQLGDILPQLRVDPTHQDDDVIDTDVILIWGDKKRIITGADILGRLLRGIVKSRESS